MKRILLYLLSKPYGFIIRQRNLLFEARILKVYESKIPVVSVGNITAGGNAKTPLCIYLAEELKKKGFRPVVLTRGYGGSVAGPALVQESHTPGEVGDEAKLISQKLSLPVVVSRKRVAGARLIEAERLGDVIILDDGFQHRYLARAFDLVSIDSGSEAAIETFLAGNLLPLGMFREPRSSLARTQAIILAERGYRKNSPATDPRVLALLPAQTPVYRAIVQAEMPRDIHTGAMLQAKEVVAICGLANPEGFFATVKNLGIEAVHEKAFPDHHRYTTNDVQSLMKTFPGVPVVCTEKDAVKLRLLGIDGIFSIGITLKLHPADAFIVQVVRSVMNWKQRKVIGGSSGERGSAFGSKTEDSMDAKGK
jgi:tetraacyldisaccharide 4'-kinase